MNSHPHYLGVISIRGGGANPPVLALGQRLQQNGNTVSILCDEETELSVKNSGLKPLVMDKSLAPYTVWPEWLEKLNTEGNLDTYENPLEQWASESLNEALKLLGGSSPNAIFTSLFTPGLAASLSSRLSIKWAYINPAYAFWTGLPRSIEDDFAPGFSRFLFSEWLLPIVESADLIIHATDPEYDPVQSMLPGNHHHVGPLNYVNEGELPAAFDTPGDPWILISVSTAPQIGELDIIKNSVAALQDRPYRVLVTAPHRADELAMLNSKKVTIVDFAPHDRILEQAELFITHAGHGSVMKGLIHGVPMILVPWGRDQIGVAYRARQLGIGEIVDREKLDPEAISGAIDKVLSDQQFANMAAKTSKRYQDLDPLRAASGLMATIVD
jgi:hypothetical protein